MSARRGRPNVRMKMPSVRLRFVQYRGKLAGPWNLFGVLGYCRCHEAGSFVISCSGPHSSQPCAALAEWTVRGGVGSGSPTD